MFSWNIAFYGAGTWTLRKVDHKYLESFKMWFWRRKEKTSWTDSVKTEGVHRVEDERYILYRIKRRKANWIGYVLSRNCLIIHVIEGKVELRVEVMGRRGRRREQTLDDFKGKRGYWE
jgi:hypothetical protein